MVLLNRKWQMHFHSKVKSSRVLMHGVKVASVHDVFKLKVGRCCFRPTPKKHRFQGSTAHLPHVCRKLTVGEKTGVHLTKRFELTRLAWRQEAGESVPL